MTTTCDSLAVKKPANITATDLVLNTYDCDEPCTLDISITWQNTGGRAGTFEPAYIINGTRKGLGSNISMAVSQIYSTVFTETGLIENTYTICPDPN